MKILVVTAHDAVNLSVENVVREFIRQGHSIEIYARNMEPRHIRMFEDLGIPILAIEKLNGKKIKSFDCAFCPMDAVPSLMFYDIYIFSYNFMSVNDWATSGGDFMFCQTTTRPILQWEDCARMAVGTPKNDKVADEAKQGDNILFVDTGHYPFGMEGKRQLANALLSACRQCPDRHFVVKPRKLRDDIDNIHPNKIHLYDVLEDLCDGDLPNNLELLNVHRDMQELIDECSLMITPGSSAYQDAALRGKNVLILKNFTSENSYDMRVDTLWKQQFDVMEDSECQIDYRDLNKYLPNGLKCSEKHLDKIVAYRKDASKRVVEVVEFIYEDFLSKKKFPKIQEYNFSNYKSEIQSDEKLDFETLKHKRMKNAMLPMSREFGWTKANIDYNAWFENLDACYREFPLNQDGLNDLIQEMGGTLNNIRISNAEKLMDDPWNQSELFRALYMEKQYSDIFSMPQERIVCDEAYNYYVGLIYHQQGDFSSALYYLHEFLKASNNRSFVKYSCETSWGIKNAYIRIINMFNGTNLTPKEYAELYIKLYEKKNDVHIPFAELKKMHNTIPVICKQLIKIGEGELASYCTKLYKINCKKLSIINRGLLCLKRNGFRYTAKLVIKKIVKKILPVAIFQIRRFFKEKILLGFSAYSRIVRKYGADSFLHITGTSNGDSYLAFRYYKQYCLNKYSKQKNIFVSSAESLFDLVQWFDIENVEKVLSDELKSLFALYVFDIGIPIDILHHHLSLRHTGILMYVECLRKLNFMQMLQETVFYGIEKHKPALPDCKQELKELFLLNDLYIGRTVMLSPYAKSVKKLPLKYWTQLTHVLLDKGFSVCTNVFGEQLPLCNTRKISLPYSKMEQFLNMAGYFVSSRSGLDDITQDAICKRVEVYSKDNYFRSCVGHISESYAYSDNYILVSENNIDECVAETLQMLGIE